MNLHYLKSFYVTVKNNSISKAAKILHLTQPGLSLQLQSLEKDLDVTLLIRSNKGVELTEAGQVLFDYASTILSLQENIERDINNIKDDNHNLIVGSCKAIGEFALPCSIYVFKSDNKNVDIQMEIINSKEVIKRLLDRTINLGITSGNPSSDKLLSKKITTDRLLLVTSLPILKDKITIDEFLKLPLIFRESGSGTKSIVLDALSNLGVTKKDLNIIYELNSMEAIKNSVIAGKGISFIPELSIKRELKDGILKTIEIEGLNPNVDYYLNYSKDHKVGNPELEFEKFIMSNKRGFC